MSKAIKTNIRKFKLRNFISVTAALSFIAIAVTGGVLFITPICRVARFSGWQIMGLTKDQWRGMHLWYCLLFLVVMIIHIYLNVRALIGYFKSRPGKSFAIRVDWVLAVIICVIIFVGVSEGFGPFERLLTMRDDVKFGRNPIFVNTPGNSEDRDIGPAEPDGGSQQGSNGYSHQFDKAQIGDSPLRHSDGGNQQIRQIGRMTLGQYCNDAGLDVANALDQLRRNGVNANENTYIRDIANYKNVHPSEVRSLLEGK